MFELTEEKRRGVITMLSVIVIIGLIICVERLHSEEKAQREYQRKMKMEYESRQDSIVMKMFDPNTVTLMEMLGMGLTKLEALSVLRYREFGKVFHIKEEMIEVYNMSDSLYLALEPYIVIGEEFKYKSYKRDTTRYKPREQRVSTPPLTPSKFLIDTVGTEYLRAIGALTTRQAEVFVRWRDMSGIHSMEELRECYVVSDSIAEFLRPYAIFTPKPQQEYNHEVKTEIALIDLNNADSVELCKVRGIGAKTAHAIIEYRDLIGGFYSTTQLSQINIITESNYEKIITQIFADSCDISKIDINFASAKLMSSHPYLQTKLRRLLKKRQLKGGWSTIEEMIEDNIFTKEEAQQVRPYLHFEVVQRAQQ